MNKENHNNDIDSLEDIEVDCPPMPPKRKYKVKIHIRSVTRGKPIAPNECDYTEDES